MAQVCREHEKCLKGGNHETHDDDGGKNPNELSGYPSNEHERHERDYRRADGGEHGQTHFHYGIHGGLQR